jgi:tRNA modification GTPase
MTDRTIFALASGRGRSGVAVVRISGPGTGHLVRTLIGELPQPRTAVLRALRDPADGSVIDRGLVLWFPAPASFTGEDLAEFHVHGGPAVIEAVLAALGRDGTAMPAEAGAFTRRAFENGKLDLTAVEGLADLVAAETDGQRRQAVRQMSGALTEIYDGWRSRLVREAAHFAAQIDFPDEGDVPEDLISGALGRLDALAGEIAAHLADGRRGERLRDGVLVAIAGKPNVGKSSLLNCLARREAAIVSDRPGTTRDVVEVHLDLGGVPVILADTAGLREAGDEIEGEGVRRAERRIEEADLVLWVIEPQGGSSCRLPEIDSEALLVLNKSDLLGDGDREVAGADFVVSARTGLGIGGLVEGLGQRAGRLAGLGEQAGVTRARHRAALEACVSALDRAVTGDRRFPELIAEDIRAAATALGRLTGRVDVEDLLEVIFAEFCVGK